MIKLTVILTILFPIFAHSKQIRVAVIDSGYSFIRSYDNLPKDLKKPILCDDGHKDFTGTSLTDVHGHGTAMVGLIAKNAYKADYCIVILKVIHKLSILDKSLIEAFKYVSDELRPDVVNLSMFIPNYNDTEVMYIKKILDQGIKIVVASGNFDDTIDEIILYPINRTKRTFMVQDKISNKIYTKKLFNKAIYPRLDERMIVLGNTVDNCGKGYLVDVVINGEKLLTFGLNSGYILSSGTSASTAIFTGMLVDSIHKGDVK